MSIWPRLSVKGRGLVVRHRGRTDVPPLVSIREFSAATGYFAIFESPRRVHVVDCTGLEIHIPPRPRKPGQQPATGAPVPRPREQPEPDDPDVTPSAPPRPAKFVIDRLDSADAVLRILPRNADKGPKEFLIHRLEMSTVRLDRAMPFDAVLTNPLPRGEIHSDGSFGPWQSEEPGASPAKGKYTFDKADMSHDQGPRRHLVVGRRLRRHARSDCGQGHDDDAGLLARYRRYARPARHHVRRRGGRTNGDTFLESVRRQIVHDAAFTPRDAWSARTKCGERPWSSRSRSTRGASKTC